MQRMLRCSCCFAFLLFSGMVGASETAPEQNVADSAAEEPAESLSQEEVAKDTPQEVPPTIVPEPAPEKSPSPPPLLPSAPKKRQTIEELTAALPENAILINPLSVLVGLIFDTYGANLEYQRSFTPLMGLSVNAGFVYLKSGGTEGMGGQIEVGPRFSVFYRKLVNLYLTPYLAYGYLSVRNGGRQYDGHLMAGGVLCGYNYYWSGFMLGLGGGAEGYGIVAGNMKEVITLFPFRFRAILNLGYAW